MSKVTDIEAGVERSNRENLKTLAKIAKHQEERQNQQGREVQEVKGDVSEMKDRVKEIHAALFDDKHISNDSSPRPITDRVDVTIQMHTRMRDLADDIAEEKGITLVAYMRRLLVQAHPELEPYTLTEVARPRRVKKTAVLKKTA